MPNTVLMKMLFTRLWHFYAHSTEEEVYRHVHMYVGSYYLEKCMLHYVCMYVSKCNLALSEVSNLNLTHVTLIACYRITLNNSKPVVNRVTR
jgi:hypothetical protein